MTAQELVDLLQSNIDNNTIDADASVMEDMGAYSREVSTIWIEKSDQYELHSVQQHLGIGVPLHLNGVTILDQDGKEKA